MRYLQSLSLLVAMLVGACFPGAVYAEEISEDTTDYATVEEEQLILKGHILYPVKKIRPKQKANRIAPRQSYTAEQASEIRRALEILGLTEQQAHEKPTTAEAPSEPEVEFKTNLNLATQFDNSKETGNSIPLYEDLAVQERSETQQRLGAKPYTISSEPIRETSRENALNHLLHAVGPLSINGHANFVSRSNAFELNSGESEKQRIYRIGVKRASRGSSFWQPYGAYGLVVNDQVMLGGRFEHGKSERDYSFSSHFMNKEKSLSLRLGWGYQIGNTELPFSSGAAVVGVSQRSQLASIVWKPFLNNGLANSVINLRKWRTVSSNKGTVSPMEYVRESATSFDTYLDSRAVAFGTLDGYSAIGFGIPIGEHWTISQSIGRETIRFIDTVGSANISDSKYRSFDVQYQSNLKRAKLNLQTGVSETRTSLSYSIGEWYFGASKSNSKIGGPGYWSVGVGFTTTLENSPTQKVNAEPTIYENLLPGKFSYKRELEELITRPREFPQIFLAKVDANALQLVSSKLKNQPPIANAGPDQIVPSATTVTLSAAASSDPDPDQQLSYKWVQQAGTAVKLNDATSQQPTFTSPALEPGSSSLTLTFALTVSDGFATSDVSVVNVVVSPPTIKTPVSSEDYSPGPPANNAPTANAGNDQTVTSAAEVNLTGAASSDPDAGQTLTYAWVQTSGTPVTLSSTSAQRPTFTAPTLAIGEANAVITFALTVSDGVAVSVPDTITVSVEAPQEAIIWGSDGLIGEFVDWGTGVNVTLNLLASSSTGAPLTFDSTPFNGSLPSGLSISSAGVISGTTSAVAVTTNYTFTVRTTTTNGSVSVSSAMTIKIRPNALIEWTTAGVSILRGDPELVGYVTPTSFTVPEGVSSVHLLIVGGGGGGGGGDGGGGGGGGAAGHGNNTRVISGQTIPISVGRGGVGGLTGPGQNGTESRFGAISASGGGGGGFSAGGLFEGLSGGSGGGGSQNHVGGEIGNDCGTRVNDVVLFCGRGGGDISNNFYNGHGGGGAGSDGGFATRNSGGSGGSPFATLAALGGGDYAAGGGGGSSGIDGISGGRGGNLVGGDGGTKTIHPTDGASNTGSGGGGAGADPLVLQQGGNGADGVIRIVF